MLVFTTIKIFDMRRFILAGMALLMGITACKKEFTIHATEEGTSGKAYLKVVHASTNLDTFNIYVGGTKVNGAAITYNGIYPVSGVNSYLTIDPGTQTVELFKPGTLVGDSISLQSFSDTFEAGKYYTFILTSAGQIFTQDAFPTPDTGMIDIRFIHTVLNDTTGKTVDLYSAKHGVVAAGLSPGELSDYIPVAYNVNIKDTLYVTRSASSATPLSGRAVFATMALTTGNIANLTVQRSYTVIFKGSISVTSGTKARGLIGYVHY
ncbi:hypothetical protein BW716_01590 [[Flexibacter] sp. ATCC 35208]|nr:hypothetical protein BW716_01590 [[Flexibacter] sp. ATCC 35208]